ncbi:thioredoxin domain-containing protein [Glutamicibacter sp. PS]|uniref:thioredoxin domain-containing protein n=1 Tax=Glutamicibacter sp. PS TaxID=3075634 RepID=UPI0028490947|nr:thioredoxin domain-containing protein [Glutamicibacter sp. PS]MDR4533671.1 thioredoxin domain-containing protein [Glutamicibacter sp. PS]
MAHRLEHAASQYLRQHAHQDVDWWPYSAQAFAIAAERDVPVMLSIGYAACHWCHVMSYESFDDPVIARKINEHFVPIKVDREEHPLVDETYMMATQAMTGAGGWPMTVFALPDGRTFQAGTYYPAHPRQNTPSFTQVLDAVHEAWAQRRAQVEEQAALLASHLSELTARNGQLLRLGLSGEQGVDLSAVRDYFTDHTAETGGFSTAPKFPPTWALGAFWRTVMLDPSSTTHSAEALFTTLESILLGALHDHVGGGFARYCVDEHWSVPHFEKMLYDNAGLLKLLSDTAVLAGQYASSAPPALAVRAQQLRAASLRAVEKLVAFLERELLVADPEQSLHAFAASLDADSLRAGKLIEGAAYTFNREELNPILSRYTEQFGNGFLRLAQVAEDPGHYCLSLGRYPMAGELAGWEQLCEELAQLRAQRARPSRDAKVVAGWNGLLIEALAHAGALLGKPRWIELAERTARSVYEVHVDTQTGRLARVSFAGRAAEDNEGTLGDYAALALGFATLAQLSEDPQWAEGARQLLDRAGEFVDDTGLPVDAAGLDHQLQAQRGVAGAVSVLDEAEPSAIGLYARASWRAAQQDLLRGDPEEQAADRIERITHLVAHAGILAAQVPAQVANSLIVAHEIAGPAHYLNISGGTAEQREQARVLARALGLAVGGEKATDGEELRIEPCRLGSCRPAVGSASELLAMLRHEKL